MHLKKSDSSDDESEIELGNQDSSSDSDSDSCENLRSGLKDWAIEFGISQVAFCVLLELLRSEGLSDLPMDPRSLLSTPRTVNVDEVSGGQYYHF